MEDKFFATDEFHKLKLEDLNKVSGGTGSSRNRYTIDYNRCIGAACCEQVCPMSCIKIDDDGYPHIDLGACIGCDICYNTCPYGAISYAQ